MTLLPLLWPLGVILHGLCSTQAPLPMAPVVDPVIRDAFSDAFAQPPVYQHELIFQPVPEFVRFHAAALTECANGDLLAACRGDRPGSSRSTWDLSAVILISRKPKGAIAWTPPTAVSISPGRMDTNPVLWTDPLFGGPESQGGRIWLFHGTSFGVGWQFSRISFCFSDDHGVTWSPRQPINGVENLNTRCPPLSVPTAQGRNLVLPVYREFGMSSCLISSDNGVTWLPSERIISGIVGNYQPSLIQRSDGSLLAFMRASGATRVLASESLDGGWQWRPVTHYDLTNPFTSVAAARWTSGSGTILAYNNTAQPTRRNLTVALSLDEGRSFGHSRVITPPEAAEHDAEYPAVLVTRDGQIHIAYTLGRSAIAHDICNPAWLAAGNSINPPAGSTGPGWQGLPGLAAFVLLFLAAGLVRWVYARVGGAANAETRSMRFWRWLVVCEYLLIGFLVLLAGRGAGIGDAVILAADDFLLSIRALAAVAWVGLVLLTWDFLRGLHAPVWRAMGWLGLLVGPVALGTWLAWVLILPPVEPAFGKVQRVDPWAGSGRKPDEIAKLRLEFQTQYHAIEQNNSPTRVPTTETSDVNAFSRDRLLLVSQFAADRSITREQAESLSPYWTGEQFLNPPELQRIQPTVLVAFGLLGACWALAAVCFLLDWRQRSASGTPLPPTDPPQTAPQQGANAP